MLAKRKRETFAVIGARGRVATGDTEVRTKSAKSAELAKSVSWYTHRHLHRHWHNAHNAEMCSEQRDTGNAEGFGEKQIKL